MNSCTRLENQKWKKHGDCYVKILIEQVWYQKYDEKRVGKDPILQLQHISCIINSQFTFIIFYKHLSHPYVFKTSTNFLWTRFVLVELNFCSSSWKALWLDFYWISGNQLVLAPADSAGASTISYGVQQWPSSGCNRPFPLGFGLQNTLRNVTRKALQKHFQVFVQHLDDTEPPSLRVKFEWNWTVTSGSKVIVAQYMLSMMSRCFCRIEPTWILTGEASTDEFKLLPPAAEVKLDQNKTRVHKKIVMILKTSG